MTIKSFLLIGTLALASIASAKSYDVILAKTTQAGSVKLAAGEYSLKVQGANAIFTNIENGKSFTVAVKAADAGKKFDTTAVSTEGQNGTDKMTAIELGGSSTKLEVGE